MEKKVSFIIFKKFLYKFDLEIEQIKVLN